MFEKRVSERQKLKQLETLRDAENELYLINREIVHANDPMPLDQIFYRHNAKAMAGAKLYYECMIQRIPCVIRPVIKIGSIDAIIEINGKYVMIEFDQTLIMHKKWKDYSLDSPLIFLSDTSNIPKFLLEICTVTLSNSVFSYDSGKLKLQRLRVIHRND